MLVFTAPKEQIERPLRGEILSRDALASRAIELAEFYTACSDAGARGANLRSRFKRNTRQLQSAYFEFSEAVKNKEVLTAGAEWLLDNYHIIDEQVREIANDLPRSYYRSLPKLVDKDWKGFPRVYRLICEFLVHTDSAVDIDTLSIFIQAYQSRCVLKIGEIWAIPIMLRLALVENLRRLGAESLEVRHHRIAAEKLCEDILASTEVKGSDILVSLVRRVGDDAHLLRDSGAYVLRRLRAKGSAASLALQWFDAKLREFNLDPDQLAREEQQMQAADQISFGNCVTSLKVLASINWRDWFERVSHVDKILARDPGGFYEQCDFMTRDLYRQTVEQLAERAHKPQVEIAERVVAVTAQSSDRQQDEANPDLKARKRHIGYYLIDDGFSEFEKAIGLAPQLAKRVLLPFSRNALVFYLGSIALLTALLTLIFCMQAVAAGASGFVVALLALALPLPLSEFVILFVQWVVTRLNVPLPFPKLDFDKGISAEHKTLVVVQSILSPHAHIDELIEALEIRALGNLDPQLSFGLLLDFADSDSEVQSGDRGLIAQIRAKIEELNQQYARDSVAPFFALIRQRRWNPSENKFMGWERKRGKIEEFNRFLRGQNDTSFTLISGEAEDLRKAKYVLTLDNDTRLPPGSARKLVATMAHPLNRPVLDPERRVVCKGYGVLQPRMGIALDSALASRFSRVYSGQSGIDPYTRTVSDVYQDLFREASYIGKGIYDVTSFEEALRDRVPENSLLSHDLFEGCFARCGLVSDVELQDDFPTRYHQQARRQLRWIRGDWQILPFLGTRHRLRSGSSEVSQLSPLGRWKLYDNLRRSLVPIGTIVAIFALLFVPLNLGLFSLLFALWFTPLWLTIVNSFLDLSKEFLQRVLEVGSRQSLLGLAVSSAKDVLQSFELALYQLLTVPNQMLLSLQAIAVTLYRLFVSKRHLLEWETAHAAQRRLGPDLLSFLKSFAVALLIPAGLLAIGMGFPFSLPVIVPLAVAWIAAPFVMWEVSQATEDSEQKVPQSEIKYLQDLAFDTWCYFKTHLQPQYNYLIPDNLQVVPQRVVAERTSPTNISLSCLSIVSSTDLGFTAATSSIDLLTNVFESLSKLERFHGHFINWYDIRRLVPLSPRYISTVDSGNLLGHFIGVRQALVHFLNAPLLSSQHLAFARSEVGNSIRAQDGYVQDMLEVVSVLREKVFTSSTDKSSTTRQEALKDYCLELEQLIGWAEEIGVIERLGKRGVLHKKLENIGRLLTGRPASILFLVKLTNRLLLLDQQLSGYEVDSDERSQIERFIAKLKIANQRLKDVVTKVESIAAAIDRYLKEADFTFLLHPQKKLFVIGHNVDSGQKDNACYDLLASEARLASLVAIAQHQVPSNHWFLLGRAITDSLGGKALLSWSATMFEYLMPLLVTRDYPGTLLNRTHKAVVRAQIAYGKLRGVPWGVSESAFSGVDFEKTYQYRAFGLPGLGFKRGLADDLVISPYSTALALLVLPRDACQNLHRLEQDGLRGEFGFFEAADYTRERLGADEDKHIIRSFLAHHQGMSLVAINNLINAGVIQRRFHSYPAIQSVELLLQERFPERTKSLVPHRAERSSLGIETDENQVERAERLTTPHTWYPQTQIISNGRYSVVTSNSGSGYSVFDSEYALTRWFSDAMGDAWGQFVYVRDRKDGRFWSTTYQPCRVEPSDYEVIYNPDKVETIRRDGGVRIRQELTVSPEDPVEVKRIHVTNLSRNNRKLELTSFAEVVLATDRADKAHPAFSKLFIETEFIPDYDALLLHRKPRSHGEKMLWMFHLVSMPVVWAPLQYETDRARFIGRGRSFSEPDAMLSTQRLSGTTGMVLDPCISLRAQVEIEPGSTELVNFVTGAARTKEEALQLIRKYHETYHISRAFEMAWSHADVEIRDQQFTLSRIRDFQRLAAGLFFNVGRLRASSDIITKSTLPQAGLWRLGISGDEPIVLMVVNDTDQLKTAEELLLAHEYLRRRGLRFDLVILNENSGGYLQNLRDELDFLVRSSYARQLIDQRGGIFLRARTQISAEEELLLQSVARVVLYGERGSLSQQLKGAEMGILVPLGRRSYSGSQSKRLDSSDAIPLASNKQARSTSGFGDFNADGSAYRLTIRGSEITPLPWSNVVANDKFGFLVTESGGGYTWSGNSRENRLTPWSNDPVLDPPGEVVYIRDLESGSFWSATPAPASRDHEVTVEHGFGYSSFELKAEKINSKLTLSVHPEEEVKFFNLELQNLDDVERKLEVYLYLEWVLGVNREVTFRSVQTEFDRVAQILVARNPWNTDFSRQQAFVGSNLTIQSFTCSRREFVGRHGDLSTPGIFEQNAAIAPGPGQIFAEAITGNLAAAKSVPVMLKGSTGGGFDSCGVVKVQVIIPSRSKQSVLFFLGQGEVGTDLKAKASQYRSLSSYKAASEDSLNRWKQQLGTLNIKTPSRSFDILVNGWLLYQTLGCRMMARTGFYQSSGALGFRDQLQDSMALLWSEPARTRRQIVLHASRQFKEGDVQHWWHPPLGRGIRTRISDNYIWMPYAVTRYLAVTGDSSILDEQAKYLEGPVLEVNQMEHYFQPAVSDLSESVYQHCVRALDRSLVVGPKGLPLIGCGDWNDGMNQVGVGGAGESVWLAWFLAITLRDFSCVVAGRGDSERSARYLEHAKNLVAAVEKASWDGEWYHRAYFDDGTPLGAANREECRIDSLAQSWAVISQMADPARAKQAMNSVYRELVDPTNKLIKLLTPPFQRSDPNPGYIQGYPPGIRENGGQYTHGAAWTVWAAAILGDGAKAFELFQLINPVNHTDTREGVLQYQTEPYVTCGDVYSHIDHNGRGGWSWYTGSSGWLYQIALEAILGLKVSGSVIKVAPCIPPNWPEFTMTFMRAGVSVEIAVKNPDRVSTGVKSMTVEGEPAATVDLGSDGLKGKSKIKVEVVLGA